MVKTRSVDERAGLRNDCCGKCHVDYVHPAHLAVAVVKRAKQVFCLTAQMGMDVTAIDEDNA